VSCDLIFDYIGKYWFSDNPGHRCHAARLKPAEVDNVKMKKIWIAIQCKAIKDIPPRTAIPMEVIRICAKGYFIILACRTIPSPVYT
jgi:hypothetical protein